MPPPVNSATCQVRFHLSIFSCLLDTPYGVDVTILPSKQMSYDSSQLIPDLSDFNHRVQLNLQTVLCLLSDPLKVFILIIPLTFRPPKGRWRPFSWLANSGQASKISICTLFQSRSFIYQGNLISLLGVKSNQKLTSGKPSKFPVCSYCLGDLILMLRSYYYHFPLGLLVFGPVELLLIDHSPS